MIERFGLVPINSKTVKVGDVFGRLSVVAVGQIKKKRRGVAICKCACGAAEKAIRFDSIVKGVTTSCGCLHLEKIRTHNLTKSVHYKRWLNMIDRCENPECSAYPNYGGRGIKVFDRWHDVAAFIADLPSGYRKGFEIDRKDNDGNYEPGNIRWATKKENCDNRRSGRKLTYNGKTQSLTKWEEELGFNYGILRQRIEEAGWSIDKAINTPTLTADEVRQLGRKAMWAGHIKKPKPAPRVYKLYTYKGEQLPMTEIAKRSGVKLKLLNKRICERHWTVERATEQ